MSEANKSEYKDREYYMAECCRLRYKLKQLKGETSPNFVALSNQIENLKNSLNEKKKIIEKLNRKLEAYAGLKPATSSQKQKIKELKEAVSKLENEKQNLTNQQLELGRLKIENTKLKLENKNLKESICTIVTKNKKVFRQYFDKLAQEEQGWRCSFGQVATDIEYMHIFQKMFEMHVFDYIVDRQDPTDKTDNDTNALITRCRNWSLNMSQNAIQAIGFDIKQFKKDFKEFTDPQIDHFFIIER